jgi:hypothetical protein
VKSGQYFIRPPRALSFPLPSASTFGSTPTRRSGYPLSRWVKRPPATEAETPLGTVGAITFYFSHFHVKNNITNPECRLSSRPWQVGKPSAVN